MSRSEPGAIDRRLFLLLALAGVTASTVLLMGGCGSETTVRRAAPEGRFPPRRPAVRKPARVPDGSG